MLKSSGFEMISLQRGCKYTLCHVTWKSSLKQCTNLPLSYATGHCDPHLNLVTASDWETATAVLI